MNEDQLYDLERCLQYSMQYLRKMRQWKEGLVQLNVEGCDPPRMMSDEELDEEWKMVWSMIRLVNKQLECDS